MRRQSREHGDINDHRATVTGKVTTARGDQCRSRCGEQSLNTTKAQRVTLQSQLSSIMATSAR